MVGDLTRRRERVHGLAAIAEKGELCMPQGADPPMALSAPAPPRLIGISATRLLAHDRPSRSARPRRRRACRLPRPRRPPCTRSPTSATTRANGPTTANATTRASKAKAAADTLLEADRGHDATDCRKLFGRGRIALRGDRAPARDIDVGRLEKGDDTAARRASIRDDYTFEGRPGQRAVMDLRSGDFDPYVFVRAPSGEQFDNDDFEGDASRSLLSLDLTENGDYRVTVTSYGKGETGGYTLSIDVGATSRHRTHRPRGELENGDETLTSGEFVDSYEFEGSPGQHVAIDVRSSAFDTYLILKDPAGEQTENDDAEDGARRPQQHRDRPDRGRHVSRARDELRARRERRLCVDDRPVGRLRAQPARHARRHDVDGRRPRQRRARWRRRDVRGRRVPRHLRVRRRRGRDRAARALLRRLRHVPRARHAVRRGDRERRLRKRHRSLRHRADAARVRPLSRSSDVVCGGRDGPLPARADGEHRRGARRAALARPRLRPVRRHQRLRRAEHRPASTRPRTRLEFATR